MTEKPARKIPCEVYSRIVGYLRPVKHWNKAKKQEFADRRNYRVQGEEATDELAKTEA